MLASRIVRISLERFHPVRRSLRRRALWLIGLGVPGVVFSSFWVLLAALMLVWGEQANPWEDRAVATILFVFGLLFHRCAIATTQVLCCFWVFAGRRMVIVHG